MERLEWNKLLSTERLHATTYKDKDEFDARNEYQRDIDRIVFSSAFRRLQDKTQVMPLPTSDFVRSRLTHSVEVACIGRSLGKLAGTFIIKKENLKHVSSDDFGSIIYAACLAHDIGNPPFGHTGEKAIGKFFKDFFNDQENLKNSIKGKLIKGLTEAQKEDLICFEGNAAGFRILTNDHASGVPGGLRTTYSTLGTFSKYPRSSLKVDLNDLGSKVQNRQSQSKFGFFQEERNLFVLMAEKLGLLQLSDSKSKHPSWCRHPLSFLLEAADTITYSVIDFEDGHKVNYIDSKKAIDLLFKIINNSKDPRCDIYDWEKIEDTDEKVGALRAKVINTLVYWIIWTKVSHLFWTKLSQ